MNASVEQLRPTVATTSESRPLNVFGVQVHVLLTAEDTGGAFSTYYLECEKGASAPDHVHHREDETFFVIEGEFEFRTGDRMHHVGPGSQVFLPRDVPHKFQCVSDRGKLFGTAAPGGHERFFEDADALMQSGRFNPETATEVCARHGMDVVPPLS